MKVVLFHKNDWHLWGSYDPPWDQTVFTYQLTETKNCSKQIYYWLELTTKKL